MLLSTLYITLHPILQRVSNATKSELDQYCVLFIRHEIELHHSSVSLPLPPGQSNAIWLSEGHFVLSPTSPGTG